MIEKELLDLMLILGLNEAMDQLAMGNSVCWYAHVLRRRENGQCQKRALEFFNESQRKKGRTSRTWKKQIEVESMKAILSREDVLF